MLRAGSYTANDGQHTACPKLDLNITNQNAPAKSQQFLFKTLASTQLPPYHHHVLVP